MKALNARVKLDDPETTLFLFCACQLGREGKAAENPEITSQLQTEHPGAVSTTFTMAFG